MNYATISISANGTWAGSGKLVNGRIEDCGAQFCDDNEESLKAYDLIEEANERGDDNISIQIAGYINLNISWDIFEPGISDDLREEITQAIQDADVCCEEAVCDACLAVASAGGDWRAELAKAKANDASERKALGIDE